MEVFERNTCVHVTITTRDAVTEEERQKGTDNKSDKYVATRLL